VQQSVPYSGKEVTCAPIIEELPEVHRRSEQPDAGNAGLAGIAGSLAAAKRFDGFEQETVECEDCEPGIAIRTQKRSRVEKPCLDAALEDADRLAPKRLRTSPFSIRRQTSL
jgi:hypothetical protein